MTDTPPIILGTRGSKLALWQADTTEHTLAAAFPDQPLSRKIIKTTGDRRTDVSLAQVAKAEGIFDKGVFIKELETALDQGSIDIAVHSLKDMPTVLDDRFQLAATLPRGPVRDVLIVNFDVQQTPFRIADLPPATRVGTSAVRRAKQLTHLRPDAIPTDIRGNVPTRLEKLAAGGSYDAILLAEAGLVRLGFLPGSPSANGPEPVIGMPGLSAIRLPEAESFPAAGQGAVGLEIRSGDLRALTFCQSINHPETWLRITAEREFLRLLDAGCHTPVGVHSTLTDGTLHLRARVYPESGNTTPKTAEARGTDPIATALALYQSLS
ncbi:MAG: hydroxymethylbilane synthase [Verrucomicrobiales bacterium]|nr:hydroxymethylbilane synthase [Verrucomicrobiota bacterium JB025]